jgi:hypothetical protein
MRIGFQDHEGFHRAGLGMVAGGVLAGTAAGLGGAGVHGALFAGAAGAVLGVGWADPVRGTRLAGRVVLLAAAAGAFLLVGGHLGVLALAVVLGVALNLGSGRLVAAALVGGGIVYLGGFAAGQVMIARETAAWPALLQVILAATAMSTVCIAALLPRHLVVTRGGGARRFDPEIRELLARGEAVRDQAGPRLADDERRLLGDGVARLHELAGRWSRVDAPVEDEAVLEARRRDLDARIEGADDELAREQYQQARAAVDDQLRYVGSIRRSRERVLARLHASVTTLEKFRLAAAHLDGQQAAGGRSAPAALLSEVSADLDACGAAIAELDGHPA